MHLYGRQYSTSKENSTFCFFRLESGAHRARVITKSGDLLKPKIEMSSLVRPAPRYAAGSSALPAEPTADLDLMAMYERKNARMDAELGKLQKKLDQAQKMLAQVTKVGQFRDITMGTMTIPLRYVYSFQDLDERHLAHPTSSGSPGGREDRSAYVLKLVRENDQLRKQVEEATGGHLPKRTKICIRGRSSSYHHHHHHHCFHSGKENVAPGGG